MGRFDRDRLRTTYRKSTFWMTLFFVPFAVCLIAVNAVALAEPWMIALLAGVFVFGGLAVALGYPAFRIVFVEARRHPAFADELWLHNSQRACQHSWIVGFFSALAIANIDLHGWLALSGAAASAVIALLMLASFQASMVWLEWRGDA